MIREKKSVRRYVYRWVTDRYVVVDRWGWGRETEREREREREIEIKIGGGVQEFFVLCLQLFSMLEIVLKFKTNLKEASCCCYVKSQYRVLHIEDNSEGK
jgi:hypothetical protein